MSGREYLQNIKKELKEGHYQHKKGVSILAAFGYLRRRKAALTTINKDLKSLGLKADPPIDENMPLDSSHIIFSLINQGTAPLIQEPAEDEVENGQEYSAVEPSIPTFKVAELAAAAKPVKCIKTNEPLNKAYTIMCKNKYSQLVVADTERPLATAIKGTVTYQSIADALIRGTARTIIECLDKTTPQVSVDDDIDKVIDNLEKHDVVLVLGSDKRLSGIVTAWDLAVEFADLVGPFKWIGEIESRVKRCLMDTLGPTDISTFLGSATSPPLQNDPEMLTLGDFVRIVQNPEAWDRLNMPFDREEFSNMLDEVRELRNRLMHFRDPLTENETNRLQNYCDMVRKIPSPVPES